jgi:hypothetical protein
MVIAQDGTKKTTTVAYRVLNQYGEDITKSPLATSIRIDPLSPPDFCRKVGDCERMSRGVK